jgi:hypothetical protein
VIPIVPRVALRSIGIVAAIALFAVGLFAPRAVCAGWLIAFVSIADIVFGSVALLAIYALTGGRWGVLATPALIRAAALVPLILVFFLFLLLGGASIYPWVRSAQSAGADVGALYLNIGFFAVRGLVFIAGLGFVAWLARHARLGPLAAGLGLTWYAVGMDLIAIDWLMSIEPRYTSSAFGAQIIVEQLVAGLAWVILTTHAAERDTAWGDLGGLLLASLLGETYLILMTFIVQWYGDLPHQAAWYLRRTDDGWVGLDILGASVGSLLPLIALLFSRVRNQASALKLVSVAVLLGVLIENIWLISPIAGPWSAAASLIALVAAGGLALGFADDLAAIGMRRMTRGT